MSIFKKSLNCMILLLSLFLFSMGCNQDSSNKGSGSTDSDNSKLVVTEFPANGVSIGQHTKLVFSFNNPVDITSVIISGTLYDDCNGGAWSSIKYTNDTLTVSPSTRWETGTSQTISIEAINNMGEAVNFNYSYTVINQVIYVSPNGADYSPGSLTQPKRTIQAAIKQAIESDEVTEIHVAEGTYFAGYQDKTNIELKDGIMLYGGYSATNLEIRNTDLYETIIQDSSIIGKNNCPLSFDEEIRSYAIVDGFTIKAGAGEISSAVKINSSAALLSNNKIVLGKAFETNYGILLSENISPIIENNTIIGNNSKNMYGIYNNASTPKIIGNTIEISSNNSDIVYGIYTLDTPELGPIISKNRITLSSTGSSSLYNLYCKNSALTITNNYFNSNNEYITAITLDDSSIAMINNIIDLTSDGGRSIYNINDSDKEGYMLNNTFVGSTTKASYLFYVNTINSSTYDYPDLTAKNNLISNMTYLSNEHHSNSSYYSDDFPSELIFSNNNIDVNFELDSSITADNTTVPIIFADETSKNFNLTSNTSASITEGGLDGSSQNWLYNYDFNGKTRTGDGSTGWSIGAFEFDNSTGTDYPIDQYEDDNTVANAKTINHSSIQERSLHMVDDIDYIAFTVPAELDGLIYNIDLTSSTDYFDATIELYDSSNQLIRTNSSKINALLTQGSYYLKIFSNGTSGEYTLTVGFPSDIYESNNTTSTANILTLNSNIECSLHTYDKDIYTFSIDTMHDINIELNNILFDLDLNFKLFHYVNNTYTEIIHVNNTGSNGNESTNQRLNVGTYYVEVNSENNYTGTYSLNISGTDLVVADTLESNNSFAEASPLQMASTINATLTPNDVDYYTFEVINFEDVSISLNNIMYDLDISMEIYDADNNQIVLINNNIENEAESLTIQLPTGTYYVIVKSENNIPGSYSLNLSTATLVVPDSYEINNSYAEATPISANTSLASTIISDDIDIFTFEIDTIQDITISLNNLMHNLDISMELRAYNYSLISQVNNNGINGAESTTESLNPGVYYVVVKSIDNTSGSYSINFTGTTLAYPDSYESNNDFDQAKTIQPGTPLSLTLLDNDVDYFTFEVANTQQIEISLENVLYDLDVSLEIYDSSQTKFATINSNGINSNESYSRHFHPGSYYIVVSRINNTIGSYTLKTTPTNITNIDPNENNNTAAQATPIQFATAIAASLEQDDIDYYSFNIANTTEIQIALKNVVNDLDVILKVYDSNNNEISTTNDMRDNEDESVILTLDAGTYYAVADNYNNSYGNYTIRIHDTSTEPTWRTKDVWVTSPNYPYDYDNNRSTVYTIDFAGASKVKIHFRTFKTEQGDDVVTLENDNTNFKSYYSGNLEPFVSHEFNGDTIKVYFRTGYFVDDDGWVIDKIYGLFE